jgi:ppGpp synthetase/RelA/SpoT-type nucleotidyltranferase
MHDPHLAEFRMLEPTLLRIAQATRAELEALVSEHGLPAQSVSFRVKEVESLRRKLERPDRTYSSLWDITDLVAVRVTLYFEDALEALAKVIERTFAIDFERSVDKRLPTDPRRFGYRSLHYICELRPPASLDPRFRFEIQLRTLLQHAWAEVEHDLGYKAVDALPASMQRRFARVASLLEIADEEFVSLRRELTEYRARAAQAVADQGGALPLDSVSLETLTRAPPVALLDAVVARHLGKPHDEERVFYPPYLLRMLHRVGLVTLGDALAAVGRHGDELESVLGPYFGFAAAQLGFDAAALPSVPRGYALLFIAHLVIVRGADLGLGKVGRLTQMYADLDFGGDDKRAHAVAVGLLAALTPREGVSDR